MALMVYVHTKSLNSRNLWAGPNVPRASTSNLPFYTPKRILVPSGASIHTVHIFCAQQEVKLIFLKYEQLTVYVVYSDIELAIIT